MHAGPCGRLPCDLSGHACLILASNIRLRLGMVRLTSQRTRLYCLPRSALPPPGGSSHTTTTTTSFDCNGLWQLGDRDGSIKVCWYHSCSHFYIRKLLLSPRTPPVGDIPYPCTLHQHREPLRCATQQVGCVVAHYQKTKLHPPAGLNHISCLPRTARQRTDKYCFPPSRTPASTPLESYSQCTCG